ncbi:MAG: hypothetical protein OQJ97_15155 [Rhodospirillales bacterium]|nr:hypothetical protein [Rhodospirillales bacterium]
MRQLVLVGFFCVVAGLANAADKKQAVPVWDKNAFDLAGQGFEVKAIYGDHLVMQKGKQLAFCDVAAFDKVGLGRCHANLTPEKNKLRLMEKLLKPKKPIE